MSWFSRPCRSDFDEERRLTLNEPSFQTERLLLRPFRESDIPYAHAWFSDADVMRYIPSGLDTTLEMSARRVLGYIQHQRQHGFSKWMVIERASGTPIGDSGILHIPGTEDIELGYRFAKQHWGHGYATEVAAGWLEYAFQTLMLPRFIAFAHPENTASIRVLEKIGMRYLRMDQVYGIQAVFYEAQKDYFRF
jgi:ribosomal-protein-alanine N-acetyltransferase